VALGRRSILIAAAAATAGAVAVAVVRGRSRNTRRAHPVLEGGPLMIAHRGGSGLAPENTLAAFVSAATTWGADMMELDVHATADGHCVVIHDPTVERTTDGSGAVAHMSFAQIAELDAGYRFTRDGAATFPFRGKGVRVPSIVEVLEALPEMRFTIEVKHASAQRPLFDAIERFGAAHRVVAAGMYNRVRTLFARHRGAVSASTEQVRTFITAHRLRLDRFIAAPFDVVQLPETHNGDRVVTPRLVRALHRRGIPLHVWTVNDAADMERLLDWRIDGIVTDRPDTLGRVLHTRSGRPLAAGHAQTAR
jgi:glycerophosphoryl diester phosphodiesterase